MTKTSYLDPLVLARISNLQLRAKSVVEGFVAGLHQSHYQGYSLEFAQHREYSTGDELKHIDWKVYGRTDRFFVKQFEQETNLRVYLLLDASGSMSFKGEKSALSKYDYAATLAASLGYLTLRQGDSVGLGCFNNARVKLVPPRNSFSHLNALLEEIESVRPEGETTLANSLENIAHSVKKRSLFILISDLFDDANSVLRALKFLRFKKNEVWIVHLLDRDEKDFPYSGSIRFDSLENQKNIVLEPEQYRKDYQNAIQSFVEQYRVTLRNFGMNYRLHITDEPLDKVLRFVLSPMIEV